MNVCSSFVGFNCASLCSVKCGRGPLKIPLAVSQEHFNIRMIRGRLKNVLFSANYRLPPKQENMWCIPRSRLVCCVAGMHKDTCPSQSIPYWLHIARNSDKMVWLNLSVCPSVCGSVWQRGPAEFRVGCIVHAYQVP